MRLLLVFLFLSEELFAQSLPHENYPKGTIGGRYQFVQVSEFRRDQYLIDTETGRVWQMVCAEANKSECTQSILQEIFVQNNPKSEEFFKKAQHP